MKLNLNSQKTSVLSAADGTVGAGVVVALLICCPSHWSVWVRSVGACETWWICAPTNIVDTTKIDTADPTIIPYQKKRGIFRFSFVNEWIPSALTFVFAVRLVIPTVNMPKNAPPAKLPIEMPIWKTGPNRSTTNTNAVTIIPKMTTVHFMILLACFSVALG